MMNPAEYAGYDALGLAELVANKQVTPKELAYTAAAAIASMNPAVNAVVETYPDRIDDLDEKTLGTGPFRGVPFLIKDFFGHEAGRTIEFGSRLCRGMVAQHDTHLCELFKASGLNILGRSAAPEYSMAVERVATVLADMGHQVSEESPDFDGLGAMRSVTDVWFFGFDLRLEGYAKRSGHAIGPGTLEPVTLKIYEHARRMKAVQFLNAPAAINTARRQLGRYFTRYDVWLSPTTARVAEPWGTYNLGRSDVTMDDLVEKIFRGPCQFTLPHNILGIPAISLPLAMHSTGLPIGVQLGAGPAAEHVILQLAAALEAAMPWTARVPPCHVSTMI
jgi:Asp-tRNA(Asn)/Glu-tRNA(Gln) amidotransferase A subunit family amidase